MEKKLMKISGVKFGHVGCQESQLGISFDFESKGCGVGSTKATWDPELIKWTENCKWTERDREKELIEIMKFISKILKQAKVEDVTKLKGIPVEVEFDGNMLKSWRILEEVL